MTAPGIASLRRLAAMDRREASVRLKSELHKLAGRLRHVGAPPSWQRARLPRVLAAASPDDSLFLSAARGAANASDWVAAHRALARHVLHQTTPFPLAPSGLDALVARIVARFPDARDAAVIQADRIVEGRYDLLGYRDLDFGRPPRWHHDPVHQRNASGGFWSTVPYLDPAGGDHKVIWELNRHQHWLVLARAHALSGDARYYDEFVIQLHDWMQANPPLEGMNWASMLELAFRSLSWLWALHLFAPTAVDEQAPATPWMVDLLLGLDRQLTHVEQNLSLYFSPNTHLSGEALALYVAGVCLPELRRSGRRAAIGRRVLLDEIRHQVCADGGHAERSAHYHRYSTDFYLLALQVARASRDDAADAFAEAAHRQARYLRTIADDRGRLPLLGDDDGGQLFPICRREPWDCRDTLATAAALLGDPALALDAAPEETFWLVGSRYEVEAVHKAPGRWPSAALAASGYCVSRTSGGDHLVLDAGPHGFLNGGHAHSDALSVVASVAGLPLLVDPGTATYTMDPATRDKFRSTAMHNTVVIDGRAQSRPRGPFHWQRTADATLSLWREGDGCEYMESRHGAYAPLVHARAVLTLHHVAWFVIDHFVHPQAGGEPVTAEAFWHFDPAWKVASTAGTGVLLRHENGRLHAISSSGALASVRGTSRTELAVHAPAYGTVVPAECLLGETVAPAPRSVLTVIPMFESEAAPAVHALAITEPAGSGWHTAAFRVRFDSAEALILAAIELDGVPPHELAAPAARWGTADAQVVGRMAIALAGPSLSAAALVNGRHLAAGGSRINHDLPQPLIQVGSLPRPAGGVAAVTGTPGREQRERLPVAPTWPVDRAE